MSNSRNSWGVRFSRITWLEDALSTHGNVSSVLRERDIIFNVHRRSGCPLIVACLDEYSMGESAVQRVFTEFKDVNFIHVGGFWNKYTPEAKELCLSRRVGLYNSSELTGALWKDEFWSYHKQDKKGRPVYEY